MADSETPRGLPPDERVDLLLLRFIKTAADDEIQLRRDEPLWAHHMPTTGDTIQGKQKETVAAVNGTPNQRKRKRTLYSKWQQLELESVFEVIPYPDINTREQLAKIIRLPESKVQVWFQNRRARKNKSGKLDKTLYRRSSLFRPAHLCRNAMSPSHNYSQRDTLITMTFPPNLVGPYGHDYQQVPGVQQPGFPPILQESTPIFQQYSAEETYHCTYEHSQWQNLTLSGVNSGYGCEATVYGTPIDHCASPSLGPSYWELFPHTVSANGSQTSLGYISDVIYNAAILTNLGDL
ncbi:PREDICTED: homeobox protein SEBOX [Nanorana parkeri]|uniref:homeobox protein SEBOX n=1 Tax=Nanorana parkeri TaxID=125878 RepID=UPI000854802C|nr:PREDICTED: homeobox protein SEBOX [Nanorana parkeri]